MPWIARRAHEFVVGNIEPCPEPFEPVGIGIDEIRHGQAGGFRRADILQAVVIGAALKADVSPEQAEMTGIGIGLHEFERKAHMRGGIHIGY